MVPSFAIKTKLCDVLSRGCVSPVPKITSVVVTDVLVDQPTTFQSHQAFLVTCFIHLVQREHLLDEVFRLVRHCAPILRVERYFPCAYSSSGVALNNERRETETDRERQTTDRRREAETERRRKAQARRLFDLAQGRQATSSICSPQPHTKDNGNATPMPTKKKNWDMASRRTAPSIQLQPKPSDVQARTSAAKAARLVVPARPSQPGHKKKH